MIIDYQLIVRELPQLLRGAIVSLEIAVCSCAIGFSLGTLFGLGQEYGHALIRWPITILVTIIRGTPMLIQIFIAYYALPQLGISFSAFWTAILAIGINSSAYISNTIRSGIASVGKGQIEAAQVLGLNLFQTVRFIVLPQALSVILPSLGNELITLIKDSALASIIGVVELSKEGSIIRSKTYDAITTFFIVALIYLTITTVLSICLHYFERRIHKHARY